jgi:acyl-CoA synthetase (AMP-forming)/AMP-acid ligase II
MDENSLAYIIFTSGTTGAPKGVTISAGNVRGFVDSIQERYRFQPGDRVAQPSEVSFDNSVFDLFNAWEAGAALYVVPLNQLAFGIGVGTACRALEGSSKKPAGIVRCRRLIRRRRNRPVLPFQNQVLLEVDVRGGLP